MSRWLQWLPISFRGEAKALTKVNKLYMIDHYSASCLLNIVAILPYTQFRGRQWEISVDKMKTKVQRGFDRDSFVSVYLVW